MHITIHRSDVEMAVHSDNCSKMRTNGMGSCNCGADEKTEELRKSGFKTFAELAESKKSPRPVVVKKPKRFSHKRLRTKIAEANNILWTLGRIEIRHTEHCSSHVNRLTRECNCYVERIRKLHYNMAQILSLRE